MRNFTSKFSNFFQNIFKASFVICKGKPFCEIGHEIIYLPPLSTSDAMAANDLDQLLKADFSACSTVISFC